MKFVKMQFLIHLALRSQLSFFRVIKTVEIYYIDAAQITMLCANYIL